MYSIFELCLTSLMMEILLRDRKNRCKLLQDRWTGEKSPKEGEWSALQVVSIGYGSLW